MVAEGRGISLNQRCELCKKAAYHGGEVFGHPQCERCGILMGEGHVERALAVHCSTCQQTIKPGGLLERFASTMRRLRGDGR